MHKELLPLLMQAIADKERSQARLQNLAVWAKDAKVRQVIESVMEGELRHLESLRGIAADLTPMVALSAPARPRPAVSGVKPPPTGGRPHASSFASGRVPRW